MAKDEVKTNDVLSFSEFKRLVRDDLRELPNCWFMVFEIERLPEFVICLNGSYVALKIKKLVDDEEDLAAMAQDIRDANGLYLEITRHNWPSVLKSLEFLSSNENSFNN